MTSINCLATLLVICCSGCGRDDSTTNTSSNSSVAPPNPVEDYLAYRPPTIQHDDWMQINNAGDAPYPTRFYCVSIRRKSGIPKFAAFGRLGERRFLAIPSEALQLMIANGKRCDIATVLMIVVKFGRSPA